jgi:hypothetical protein
MDTKKILSWIALSGGEAVIIAAFILFRGDLADNVLVLNMVVSSLVYGLFFIDILVPLVDLGDESHKRVGSTGLRWFFTWLYALFAIAAMLVCNLAYDCSFALQIIIHSVPVFLLLIGFVSVIHSSDKVRSVYRQETFNRNGIIEMKKSVANLKDKISDLSDLPESFTGRINSLEENLRFISPTENAEAHSLEQQFISAIDDIAFAVSDFSMNGERIESNLKKCERICQSRKAIYST